MQSDRKSRLISICMLAGAIVMIGLVLAVFFGAGILLAFTPCVLPMVPILSGIIVGAGHAGFQLGASLRQDGFAERIALINDEGHLPYQRPPLSKAYLKGEGKPDSLMFRPDKFYRDQNIELISDRAVSIDRAACKVFDELPAERLTESGIDIPH